MTRLRLDDEGRIVEVVGEESSDDGSAVDRADSEDARAGDARGVNPSSFAESQRPPTSGRGSSGDRSSIGGKAHGH